MKDISRRRFLRNSTGISLGLGLAGNLHAQDWIASYPGAPGAESANDTQAPPAPSTLAGTTPLTMTGDLASQMVDGIHRFLLRRTQEAAQERGQLWQRDYRSAEDYNRSVSPNRERLRQIIGAVDPRVAAHAPQQVGTISAPAQVSEGPSYKIYAVRWAVCEPVLADFDGFDAEGLLLEPTGPPVARVVAMTDAGWPPETVAGLIPVPDAFQFARHLAENGCQVLVPLLINREDTFSGTPGIGMMNEPHREWIYRMAFEVGRHIIGYEVQKVLAAIDWFASENLSRPLPIGVIGFGEGGLLALYSAAIDLRIAATVVSGYFQAREGLWQEPIYRDVWGLVREFGDAELASLIAPRALIIEASRGPEVEGPPPATKEHKEGACPNGRLVSPPLDSVQREVERAREFFAGLGAERKLELVVTEGGGDGLPASEKALQAFLRSLGVPARLRPAGNPLPEVWPHDDPGPRLQRQFDQLVGFTQALIRKAPDRRAAFWSKADSSSLERWKESTKFYRDFIWQEVIGRLPSPSLPPNPRTRLVFDQPKFRGYEVVLDVWPDVFAYGILLIPKDIKPGERRPVVVCQHGLEGRPRDVADPDIDSPFYHRFAARLAEEGFVTYAPQNPYIGEDHFRTIQRMGHPLKLALFSFILGQHEQALNWLAEQSFVDPERIGFYGLSYGGKTAVRVPPFLDRYALSICSGDFNEWVWKTTNPLTHYSYLFTGEYDMYEFNFANVVNYGELANLMAPRPFMVEWGHDDGVGMDEWISYEYAKVRRFYDKMGIPDRTSIEFFNGPHTIHGVATFEFLRRHLRWPGQGKQEA
jgi:dienelactone hydrolase